MISLSDHMGGNWTDVTEDYYYEFSYNSNDGSLVLELHLDDDATITEGTYEFQMEFYIPDMDSYYTFGFRFEREIGEVTDPTDPTTQQTQHLQIPIQHLQIPIQHLQIPIQHLQMRPKPHNPQQVQKLVYLQVYQVLNLSQ